MNHTNLTLSLLSDTFAICRLEPEADIPSWALAGDFFSVTRTKEELSLVCLQKIVPEGTRCEKDFRWTPISVDFNGELRRREEIADEILALVLEKLQKKS